MIKFKLWKYFEGVGIMKSTEKGEREKRKTTHTHTHKTDTHTTFVKELAGPWILASHQLHRLISRQ